MFYVYVFTEQRFYSKLSRAIPVGLWIMIRNARLRLHVLLLLFLQTLNKIVQFSSVGISTRSMLITSGPALAQALYDREQEGLPSLQTLIYKTCSFWNWLWPLPHLQWTSALNCMGFLISLCRSLCSLISQLLFFCWDIKVCTVTLAHSRTLTAYHRWAYKHIETDSDAMALYCTHTC